MHVEWTRYWAEHLVPWIQVLIAVGILAMFAAVPRFGERFLRPIEHFFSVLSSKKTLAVFYVFLITIVTRTALLPVIGTPFSLRYDERSYLLMGEMFLSGHLAYPQHPLWKSFETFNVNFFPTYSSMYPPAQGAILAMGKLLGHPWIGVLLSMAAMCAAIVWMLQAWMPARWAFLSGIIAFCNFGIASYWMNSYWGGTAAAIGGVMVLGSLPRIFRTPKIRYSLVLAIGVAVLANSRPYEGLFFCIPAAVWLLIWLTGKRSPPLRSTAITVVLPVITVLCLTAAFMAYYNWRLTGNALLMPHSLNFRVYYRSPTFIWQQPETPIHYNNEQYEVFYNDWIRKTYDGKWRTIPRLSYEKARTLVPVFLWPGSLPSLYSLPFIFPSLICIFVTFRDRRMRLLWFELFFSLTGMFFVVYFWPHYAAPITGVIYGLLVQGIRHLRVMQYRGKFFGVGLTRASVSLLLVATALNVFHWTRDPDRPYSKCWSSRTGSAATANIEEQLERIPGNHLIVVRYGPQHNVNDEWVFNHADIDASQIVWARELNQQQNAELFAYFRDRHTWLIEPDRDPKKVVPYPAAPQ